VLQLLFSGSIIFTTPEKESHPNSVSFFILSLGVLLRTTFLTVVKAPSLIISVEIANSLSSCIFESEYHLIINL
jgi:hypothetical protein